MEDRDFEAHLEMFSEYALLLKRLGRLRRDISPAKKHLLEAYNREIALDLTSTVATVSCGRFFLAGYIATTVLDNVCLRSIELDTQNPDHTGIMAAMFDRHRGMIRRQVAGITEARAEGNTLLVT